MKNLVIVESPAKAKTIEKYLGSDFVVASSFGHIRDLPKKGLNIDKEHGFAPTYEVATDKKKVVSGLKKMAKEADNVWLASDEDREGEAIAWHLCEALGLDDKTAKRIVFHEITKQAILEAVANPRTVDKHLVDAQQARRVLDRLVGYELSPVLWKKVRSGLSAGRVQSVAVRLIVEREHEIKDFGPTSSYKISANFKTSKNTDLGAELSVKLIGEPLAKAKLEQSKTAKFTVLASSKKPGTRSPSAPFITSTLQQEAARRLGYSVRQTMTLAQRLYENGHITYMRTDSTNLSSLALEAAKNHITKNYGAKYHQTKTYKTKQAGAQEAHEAIRPTDVNKLEAGNDSSQARLYELIWQRFTASQMTSANIERTEYEISDGSKETFVAKGEILLFDGFLKVYGGGKSDVILPDVSQGEKLELKDMAAAEQFSRPPARYSEASLVRALEEMGIGRPSTYAPTISTIQDRGYIEKQDLEGELRTTKQLHMTLPAGEITTEEVEERFGTDKSKLIPTALAEMSTTFLVKYFAPIVDYDFTATVEREFDEIADGKKQWNKMIAEFYNNQFSPLVEASAGVSRSESAQMRKLGDDPKTHEPVYARFGRYGPMLQRGDIDDADKEKKPTFAPLPDGTTLDSVDLGAALKMFELPRTVGKTEGGEAITANVGRFGPYVQVGKIFVSIKEHDPFTIDEATARRLIIEKAEKIAQSLVADFGKIQVKIGRYGPYITDGKKNAPVPKEQDPAKLTEKEAKLLLAAAPTKKRRFVRRSKK